MAVFKGQAAIYISSLRCRFRTLVQWRR